jgi:uncharacterized protein (TIGR00288 family)
MTPENEHTVAVLIDADNVPSKPIKEILAEVSKYGNPTIKRIYADWTRNQANSWKSALLEHAVSPVQQFAYTVGKNATDSAMIIDAMDILYSGRVTAFALVSSDSDFTKLATRLREAGMLVIGLGEKKTPAPFISACNKFIFIENLSRPMAAEPRMPQAEPAAEKPATGRRPKGTAGRVVRGRTAQAAAKAPESSLEALLREAVTSTADEDGWATLSSVGHYMTRIRPDFDPRSHGHTKLSTLFGTMACFNVAERTVGTQRHMIVRLAD